MTHVRSKTMGLVALCTVLVGSYVPAGGAGAADSFTRPARLATAIPAGSTALGTVPDDQTLDLEVVLAPSHRAQLDDLIAMQRDPTSPQFEQYLAPGEFAKEFGPGAAQTDAVTGWLRSVGLDHFTTSGSAITVHTTAGAATRGLGVSLERYRTARHGNAFFARQAPLVPKAIADSVATIVGLTDSVAAFPRLDVTPDPKPTNPRPAPAQSHAAPHADGLTPCPAANNAAGSSFFTPDEVGALYGVGSLVTQRQTGAGKKIALVELAPHSAADTSAYLSCFGLHNPVSTIKIGTGGTVDPNGTLEANIDIEEAATQAPGAAIVSYEGPNTLQGELAIYAKIVADDTAVAVSTSWGTCEASSNPSFNSSLATLLAQAAAQGQTVVAASGDSGSEDCFQSGGGSSALAVDTPADDANITGVGGTTLALNGSAEPVWNDCAGQASYSSCTTAHGGNTGGGAGGGLSALVNRPSWQPLVAGGACTRTGGGTCRQVPDVSANAGTGEIFESGGSYVAVGGTSIAAPKIAAIVADVDTACTQPLGDIAPKLITLAASGGYGTALKDITVVGNNDLTRTHTNLYATATGPDLATGVGAPMAAGWSCPQITSLSATQAAAGTSIDVTGFGLANASIQFGHAVATITAHTATTATLTVPAGTGAVTVRGRNVMGLGTRTVVFSYPGTVTTTTTTTAPPPTTTTTTTPKDPPPPPKPVTTRVYRTVASDGGIFDFGGAPFYGSTGAIHLNRPIVGMTTDRATGGYWFVASDGGIFGFHAPFLGSTGGAPLATPVVGMASTPDGKGYWLATAGGAVYAFGSAPNFGSAVSPHTPIVGIAPTDDGRGYWLAGSDGSIYNFGDATHYGSMFGTPLARPIAGISADVTTGGYWMVATDGGIFGFHAPFFGSTGGIHLNQPIVGIAPTADGRGYWMVARDGGIFSFGTAEFAGSMGGSHLNRPMVGLAPAR